jgi:hypothetical protein
MDFAVPKITLATGIERIPKWEKNPIARFFLRYQSEVRSVPKAMHQGKNKLSFFLPSGLRTSVAALCSAR